MRSIFVKTPASSANLGPGFDTLGLALTLWNETRFTPAAHDGGEPKVTVSGEGTGGLPLDRSNRIVQALERVYQRCEQPIPTGLLVECANHIPLGSGLGSSAAAVVAGLLGGNALLGDPLGIDELFKLAVAMEGHPDNVAPALYSGLTISSAGITRRVEIPPIEALVVLPGFELPTAMARLAVPQNTLHTDAVFNMGQTALVVEALRAGDIPLLAAAMQDRLHQPARLPLIPGAAQAIEAAQAFGAAAALSGAGPSVIAFPAGEAEPVAEAMQAAFTEAGLESRVFRVASCTDGAEVSRE